MTLERLFLKHISDQGYGNSFSLLLEGQGTQISLSPHLSWLMLAETKGYGQCPFNPGSQSRFMHMQLPLKPLLAAQSYIYSVGNSFPFLVLALHTVPAPKLHEVRCSLEPEPARWPPGQREKGSSLRGLWRGAVVRESLTDKCVFMEYC